MPSKARRERAARLGLCRECCYLPLDRPGLYCKRCYATHRAWRRARNHIRYEREALRAANQRLIIEAVRAGKPVPQLLTKAPPRPKRMRVVRTKRYKYKPRPLPNTTSSVLDCKSVSTDSEGVEPSAVLSSSTDPLAPQLGAPPSPLQPQQGDSHGKEKLRIRYDGQEDGQEDEQEHEG